MHQPIYWPGEDVLQTSNAGHYSFSVQTVHTDRTGPYTSWPKDAVGLARSGGLGRCGAQVSLTGSLMENLDVLENAGAAFDGWRAPWQEAAGWRTDGGNPALDLIGFGYFHPLMALVEPEDVSLQIRLHRLGLTRRFPALLPSKGLFPPETAFSVRMIPSLLDAGVEWVVVDNVHFDRTLPDYPYTKNSNLIPPNPADQRSAATPSWVSLNDIWAPGEVSAPWGYQPHYTSYTDPATGATSKIIVVPGARYEGNEDARGGFGALNYDAVLSQLEPYNTDPDHPMLVVLHHDGDNYGGGTDSYYHSNFQGFVDWVNANPTRFQCTTIQDYLALHPPDENDVIHVEDGSWSGADNGDPEFKKWNGDPGTDGYSPDRNSWAVITAARNRMATATAAETMPSDEDVLDGVGALGAGWRYMLMAEASDYWYWDGTEEWDSQPARAANLAMDAVDGLLTGVGQEAVPPTVYLPQREAYNPGGLEWGPEPEIEAITFWTYAYDVSGLSRVELRYRFDEDGVLGAANHLYDGGTWCVEEMTGSVPVSRTNPVPHHVATRYDVTVPELGGFLVDYYVEAEDSLGNVYRSPIQHVVVEDGGTTGPTGAAVYFYPTAPNQRDVITVVADGPGDVHWGINGWSEPPSGYWPAGTTAFGDGQAVDTPLSGPDAQGRYTAVIGPFDGSTTVATFEWVIHYSNDTWSTPDHQIPVTQSSSGDPSVELVRPANGAAVQGTVSLVAAAADDDGAPTVEFLLDGSSIGSATARPYELSWDTTGVSAGAHTLTARADDGQGHIAEDSVQITVGSSSGGGECHVAGTDPDAGVGPGSDGGSQPGSDGGIQPGSDGGSEDEGGDGGCGCRSAGAGSGVPLVMFGLLLLGWIRRPRRPGRALPLAGLLLVGLVGVVACGPTGDDRKDASAHDGSFQQDADATEMDAAVMPDAQVQPDAGPLCTESPEARTGTTIYIYDGVAESADPITVNTVVTVNVRMDVVTPPAGNIAFLHLELSNLTPDLATFTFNGSPLTVSAPFDGTLPLTLPAGSHELVFEASVVALTATLEVDAALGYAAGGSCDIDRSHSLAVLQVLGGVEKAPDCYDLDQARSVQVSPYVPLQSTSNYLTENGTYDDVEIDELVVGGPTCPGAGVLVHQISKCFFRQAGSTVTLSGHAFSTDPWFVDDILLVEVLDENENVVTALTTYQISQSQTLGCCTSPPCTSSLGYASGGPTVSIQNLVQGGGNNGDIAAGAFDLTSYLPSGTAPFYLRFTALDQGVEGALDRVFINVDF